MYIAKKWRADSLVMNTCRSYEEVLSSVPNIMSGGSQICLTPVAGDPFSYLFLLALTHTRHMFSHTHTHKIKS